MGRALFLKHSWLRRGAHQQQQRQQRQPRRFEVRMVPMPAGPEVVAEEFALFRKYQILNHGDAPDDVRNSHPSPHMYSHPAWGTLDVQDMCVEERINMHS